jgi:acetoin utilization protein AcuB
MNIEQLMSPVVPTLLPTDSGSRALELMEEHRVEELALVADHQYLALVKEHDLLERVDIGGTLGDTQYLNFRPAVTAISHPYQALRIAQQQDLSVVPVVDNDNNYLGVVTREDLLKYMADNSGLNNPGGIILLEVDPHNYSLFEIARICENEDTILTTTQLNTNNDTGKLEVLLKTNRTDLEPIVSSFQRHDYKILAVYGQEDNKEEVMDRYNLLMNYINM